MKTGRSVFLAMCLAVAVLVAVPGASPAAANRVGTGDLSDTVDVCAAGLGAGSGLTLRIGEAEPTYAAVTIPAGQTFSGTVMSRKDGLFSGNWAAWARLYRQNADGSLGTQVANNGHSTPYRWTQTEYVSGSLSYFNSGPDTEFVLAIDLSIAVSISSNEGARITIENLQLTDVDGVVGLCPTGVADDPFNTGVSVPGEYVPVVFRGDPTAAAPYDPDPIPVDRPHCIVQVSNVEEPSICMPTLAERDQYVAGLDATPYATWLGTHHDPATGDDGPSLAMIGNRCTTDVNLNGTSWNDLISSSQAGCPGLMVFADFAGGTPPVGPSGLSEQVVGTDRSVLDDVDNDVSAIVYLSTRPPEELVVVALGDSFSAGEGVPPFEYGLNYEDAGLGPMIGAEENTHILFRPPLTLVDPDRGPIDVGFGTGNSFGDGNGCHRSLFNYAKLFVLEVAEASVFVDRTCSGALVVPPPGAPKPPIAPTEFTAGITQADEAIDRLALAGKDAEDVDVIVLTMGGNDAGFANTIQACLMPTMVVEMIRRQNLGDEHLAVDLVLSELGCDGIDSLLFGAQESLDELQARVQSAQLSLSERFPNARIMQLTYPNLLPDDEVFAGESCSAIQRRDIAYGNERLDGINTAIRTATRVAQNLDRNVEIVELEGRFGPNALCPEIAESALANPTSAEQLDEAVTFLLAAEGSGPAIAQFADAYAVGRVCLAATKGTWFSLACAAVLKPMYDAIQDIREWAATVDPESGLTGTQLIQALLAPEAGPDDYLQDPDLFQAIFDRSFYIFHPNRAGQAQMACVLTATYLNKTAAEIDAECVPPQQLPLRNARGIGGRQIDTTDPTAVEPGEDTELSIGGFAPGSEVEVTLYSTPTDLGTFAVNTDGVLNGTITLPADLAPGVHRLVLEGLAGITNRRLEFNLFVAGNPVPGSSYSVYFNGLEPFESTLITVDGEDYNRVYADADGGVVADIIIATDSASTIDVGVVGEESGTSPTETTTVEGGIDPTPPTALPDTATVLTGESISVDVTANDTDVDDDLDPNTVTILTAPTLGEATVTNGVVIYTAGSEPGVDTLDYQVCNTAGLCDSSTLTITIEAPPGSAPVAADDATQVLTGETFDLDVLDNDTDPDDDLDEESLTITSAGTLGLAEVVTDDDGVSIAYTAGDTAGADLFTYQVCDDTGLCDTATVTVTVIAASDCTITGTSGDDTLIGTAGDDIICGLAGNDIIDGRGGNDIIFGNRGADVIDGGSGNDTIYGGRGADTIRGQAGNDEIRGGRGGDTIEGNGGDDVIRGGNGPDQISGGNDNDTIYSGKGNDTINGNAGNDTIRGLRGSDTLNGGRGNDTIYGGRGADILNGQAGDDSLYGRRGRDTLDGGAGTDTGNGGRGNDTCQRIENATSC